MRVRVLSVPDKKGQSAATMITVALNKPARVPDLHENIVSIGDGVEGDVEVLRNAGIVVERLL